QMTVYRSPNYRLLPHTFCQLPIADWLKGQSPFPMTLRTIASRVAPRACRNAAGFTLAEIIIALCLIGVVSVVVLPRFGLGTNTLSSSTRQLIGTMRTLYLTASATKRLHRLYLDLDQQSYWAVVVQPDGERPPALPGLLDKIAFPPEVRLTDVVTPEQGKV